MKINISSHWHTAIVVILYLSVVIGLALLLSSCSVSDYHSCTNHNIGYGEAAKATKVIPR